MAEFEPITSQEALDARIEDALKAYREKNGDPVALAKQLDTLTRDKGKQDKELESLRTEVAGYKTAALKSKVAREAGLPYELASRLDGDDEAALKKDAESLAKLLAPSGKPAAQRETQPLHDGEPADGKAASGSSRAAEQARKSLLNDLIPE